MQTLDHMLNNIILSVRKLNFSSNLLSVRCSYIFITIGLSLIFNGCYATRFVREIGVVHESLNITTAYKSSDGTIVLVADATRYKESPRTYYKSNKRIIMGSKDVVGKSIVKSFTKITSEMTNIQIVPVRVNIADSQEQGWHLLPDLLSLDESSEKMVAQVLRQNDRDIMSAPIGVFPVGMKVPFDFEGFKYSLIFNKNNVGFKVNVNNEDRSIDHHDEVDWWHYPFQILVVPGVIIDILTFPFQYMYFDHEIGKAFHS